MCPVLPCPARGAPQLVILSNGSFPESVCAEHCKSRRKVVGTVLFFFQWLAVREGSNSCPKEGLVRLRDSVRSFVPVCHPRMHSGCGSVDVFGARVWR